MAASSAGDRWKYDVFVSFRGEDIRKSFMDHLFKDFKQKGVQAFRDDKELPKGEVISRGLNEAIEQSRFLIVIFSKNYASSSWCLRELVKILECKEMGEPKHEVYIIFYDVKPDVVRKQTDSYAEAFAKHESSNKTEVPKWKEALTKGANLSGWDLEDLSNGYEANFIEIITREILGKLCHGPLDVGENLVGVDARVEELNLLRFVASEEVHMIGICGISGIGKTTLAKAIYNLMYVHFEGSCFCDVQAILKRKGLTGVQMQLIHDITKTRAVKISNVSQGVMVIKKMISSKPILLVLDDVDHLEQLEALVGTPNWFCRGSLIIFTGKDKQLLKSHKVDEIYDMPFLTHHEAFALLGLHAFDQILPTPDFLKLAYQFVIHLQGHPLALKVIGRSVYEKPMHVWKSQLDRLQTNPNSILQKKLRPSFDGLDSHEKQIFLDIACFFIGENKDLAKDVLDSRNYFAHAIEVLVDKSLITVSPCDMSLQMHELIQSMAREIISEESNMHESQRRLWGPSEEVYDVLSESKAIEAVEVIGLWKENSSQKFEINVSAFARMKNLQILKLPKDPNVNFFGRLGYMSNKLRYLCWQGCPFKFLPSDFYPENIVFIDLSYSHIKNLWATPKRFTRLKILKLSHCHNLTKTPDFTEITNLEELILEGCVSLVEFHPSIGMLRRLVVLNLSGCLKVDHVPQALGRIKTLMDLYIDQTSITRLPSFVFSLTNLIGLPSAGQHQRSGWLTTISQPSHLPQSLVLSSLIGLHSLQSLNLSECNIAQVPENIWGLSCLKELYLNNNNFTSLPESLSRLSHLQLLSLHGCKALGVFPQLPPGIEGLYAHDCNISQVPENIGSLSCLMDLCLSKNSFTRLPGSLNQLSRLEYLDVDHCKKLEVFPELPASIETLCARDCNILQLPENIGGLSCLTQLYLEWNNFTSLPRSLIELSHRGCHGLPSSIPDIDASNHTSL